MSGLSTIRSGQTMTIVYNDGVLRTGGICNGTAALPACVVGTAVVDVTGTWLYDQVGTPGGPTDPTDLTTWAVPPRTLRTFSSSPVLGGSATAGIVQR